MITPRELRPYQAEAVDAVLEQWGQGTRSTAVVLPTGTGKSTVIATVAAESARMGLSVALLAHRGELLDQMAATVAAVAPELPPVGIVRAEQDDFEPQIVAASFQTLVNEDRRLRVGPRRVVLVDEGHHIAAESYRRVAQGFGDDTFFCYFTATLRREDGKVLREIIDTVAFERNLRWAIDRDYLVRPTGITVRIPDLDLGKVKTTAGDFQNNDLAEVMEAETPEIVKAILLHCAKRRPIVFAASVQAAYDIADMLTGSGMVAEAVTGAMGYNDRQPIYERFRSGATQALVTVQVLTEGADFPMCDAVVIARPTQSQTLYSQMVGRALRLYTYTDHLGNPREKEDALVLDLVGTTRVLKLVTLTQLDAGATSRKVDLEGNDLPLDEDEGWDDPLAGTTDKPKNRRLGPIDTIGIDLLGPEETGILWLGTARGVPFVIPPESKDAIFLWSTGTDELGIELFKVGVMTVKGAKRGDWLDNGRAWPLAAAKDIAEDYITDSGYPFPLRAASWRRSAPPSDKQINYARRLGITDCEQMTKARLSDEISIAVMSDRLDSAR